MGNTNSVTDNAKDCVQRRGPSPVKLVDLILATLPIICNLCRDVSKRINKRDKRYGYLGNIQSSTATLQQHLEALKREGSIEKFRSQIKDLADHLERIFSPDLTQSKGKAVDGRTRVSQYERLKTVQVLISQNGGQLTGLEPKDILDSEMMSSPSQWKKLQRELEFITDEIQGCGDDIYDFDEDMLAQPNEPSPEMREFADGVFKAMSCDCHSQFLRGSRLRMGTYQAVSNDVQKSLCVLLEQVQDSQQWGVWHELLIRDHIEINHPRQKVRFSLPGQAEPYEEIHDSSTSEAIPCIYGVLQDPSTADLLRLNFILNRGVLHPSSKIADERTIKQDSLKEEVNLKDILASPQKEWPETSKWALAVILAWSLHHLYGGLWVRGGWSREKIVFFRSGSRIPLRPFLGVSDIQTTEDGRSKEAFSLHRYPEILELGVILLELHLGQRLEDFLELKRELSGARDFSFHAMSAFSRRKQHIFSLRYRNAIDTCLHPDTKLGPNPSMQDVRDLLFKHVVKPLEEELVSNFQEWFSAGNLDEQAEKHELPLGWHLPNQRPGTGMSTSVYVPTDASIHPLLRSRGRR